MLCWAQSLSHVPLFVTPMDCSPPGSSVHEDSPGQNTGVGGHAPSRGSSQPRGQAHTACISCIGRRTLYFGSAWLHKGFLQLWQVKPVLRCGAQASHCSGFSHLRAWALGLMGCCSHGMRAQLPCDKWNLPGPGMEPVYHALTGRFLTTGPPETSPFPLLLCLHVFLHTVSS